MDFVSLVVLIICVNRFHVSGQYFQYKSNDGFQPVTNKQIESATQPEYEYYDEIDESSTLPGSIGATATTTTTTSTTQKPITTTHRFLTTRRSSFRTSNFNKKKSNVNQPYYSGDSYTEASNENEFVQQQSTLSKAKQPTPPQLRNSVVDLDRRVNGKDDNIAEKKSSSSIDSDNASYVSRRYARFLFKLRTG